MKIYANELDLKEITDQIVCLGNEQRRLRDAMLALDDDDEYDALVDQYNFVVMKKARLINEFQRKTGSSVRYMCNQASI